MHRNFFQNNVKMKEDKIQFFYIDLYGAWIRKRLHMSSRAMCCQTPHVIPIDLKINAVRVFNMLNPNVQSDLLSDHSRHTSFQ